MKTTIKGIGVHLPSEVRTNAHWSSDVVAGWTKSRTTKITEQRSAKRELTAGEKIIADAMGELRSDPFVGAKERRVLAADLQSSDMENAAAEEALARAGVSPDEVDLLLVYTLVPDKLAVPNAYVVHRHLQLSATCMTMQIDAACNSFLVPMTMAKAMIDAGTVRNALLVQSCTISRIGKPEEPSSAWFGDGATAVVLGRSKGESGIISEAHHTNSTLYRAFTATIQGGKWFEEGRTWLMLDDPETARAIVYGSADSLRNVSLEALQKAEIQPTDVDFYGAHPATPFAVRTSKEYIGLDRAVTVDTFPFAGNLGASNIPLVLATGEREGLLKAGQHVLLAGGGAGGSWSSIVMRWGD